MAEMNSADNCPNSSARITSRVITALYLTLSKSNLLIACSAILCGVSLFSTGRQKNLCQCVPPSCVALFAITAVGRQLSPLDIAYRRQYIPHQVFPPPGKPRIPIFLTLRLLEDKDA